MQKICRFIRHPYPAQSKCSQLSPLSITPFVVQSVPNKLLNVWKYRSPSLKYSQISAQKELPSSLKALLLFDGKDQGNFESFPSTNETANLIRTMKSIDVDVNGFEDKLLLTSDSRDESREYLKQWGEMERRQWGEWSPGTGNRTVQLDDNVKKMADCYLHLENTHSFESVDGRLRYIVICWRLAKVMEDVLKQPDVYQSEITFLDTFCSKMAKQFNNSTLLYFYWINLLRQNTVYTMRTATRLLKKHPGLKDQFLTDISEYCDRIETFKLDNDLPRALDIGNLVLLTKNIDWSKVLGDELASLKLEANTALVYWYADLTSNAFSILAKVSNAWYKDFNQHAVRLEIGCDLIRTFVLIIEEIVEDDLDDMHHALDNLFTNLTRVPFPVLQWIYLELLNASNARRNNVQKCDSLTSNYPELALLGNSDLKKYLNVVNVDTEIKRNNVSLMLKQLDQVLLKHSELNGVSSESNGRHLEENLRQGATEQVQECRSSENSSVDPQFRDLIQANDYDTAIKLMDEGTTPSDEVVLLLAEHISDVDKLATIRTNIPFETSVADKVYTREHTLRMQIIYTQWKQNQRAVAIYDALRLYRSVLDEEWCIQSETYRKTKGNILSFLNYFLLIILKDEVIQTSHKSVLEDVEKYGINYANTNQDYGVLVIYWEALFFSNNSHKLAEEYLQQHPKVARHIDMDSALIKCKKEEHFLKLLQICLRFDLDTFVKGKVMGQWIIFQCEKGTSEGQKRATELIRQSRQMQIPLAADAIQMYMELGSNLASLNIFVDLNLVSRIAGILTRDTKENNKEN